MRALDWRPAAAVLAWWLGMWPGVAAVTVGNVIAGNGAAAVQVQWTDAGGQPRKAVLVKQSAGGPGYLYELDYQINGSTRTCTGAVGTGYPGDGFVQNHTAAGGDYNSLDQSVPGTTTTVLAGSSHAIIAFSMPTYAINGQTVPTTVYWFFADGRSHPIFALSQDARGTSGNLGADTRSPYGSINFDGNAGNSDIGGASYGDTLKFVTLAGSPELVSGLSGWSDTLSNTIPYVMQWASTNEANAEWGHVATLPISVQDQGADRDVNSTYDPRGQQKLNGPMIPYGASGSGADAWAFQCLDYILHPDWSGDVQGAGDSIQVYWSKLAWGGNFGRVGGFNNGNGALDPKQYWQHSSSGANIDSGTRVSGMLMAYSVFVVLGPHSGSYTNGSVAQEVAQMENSAAARLAATIGTVRTNGPAGVGNAANTNVTYSPAGFNPIYASWELTATTNAVNATLTPGAGKTLNQPLFVINNYTATQLPAAISAGPGWTTAGVDYFATLDTAAQKLWITVNHTVGSAMNLVVSPVAGGGQAPAISTIPSSGYAGSAIVITGQNFTGATVVAFDGVSAAFTVNSATQITATVPAAATVGTISVTTPYGMATSATTFTPIGPPTIQSFPASGTVGSQVTITGQNFTGATNVSFNGLSASFQVDSATQITATVPAGVTAGPISVATPGGRATSTATFTPLSAPASLILFDATQGLLNGFQDWSWATVNEGNTTPAFSGGPYSLSVSGPAYNALSLYNPTGVNTAPYSELSFWINGGASGAQGLQVMGVVGSSYQAIYSLPALPANAWQQFTVPLSLLGVANIVDCNGFWFWPTTGGSTTFYVDQVQLAAPAPATPVLLKLLQPQPVPGALVCEIQGTVGQAYVLETSTNLSNWTQVSSNVLSASSLNVTNPISAVRPRQFWKLGTP